MRHGRPAGVLVPPDDLGALEETVEILVTPGALEAIREGDADADSGRFVDPRGHQGRVPTMTGGTYEVRITARAARDLRQLPEKVTSAWSPSFGPPARDPRRLAKPLVGEMARTLRGMARFLPGGVRPPISGGDLGASITTPTARTRQAPTIPRAGRCRSTGAICFLDAAAFHRLPITAVARSPRPPGSGATTLRRCRADFVVLHGMPIVPSSVLDLARLGVVDTHDCALPRTAAPSSRAGSPLPGSSTSAAPLSRLAEHGTLIQCPI